MGTDPEILVEIELAVREAVARFGLAGRVVVTEGAVRLEGSGPTVWQSIEGLAATWAGLPPDARSRRATEIARKLAALRRGADASSGARGRRRGPNRRHIWIALALVVAVALLIAFEILATLRANERIRATSEFASAEAIDAYEAERRRRAERVCNATRSRVKRGAAVGPADVEGWVVELTLLGAARSTAAQALESYLGPEAAPAPGKSRLSWGSAPVISQSSGPSTFLALGDASIPGAAAPAVPGSRVTFTGRYVVPYFHEKNRAEYVRLASSLARDTHARHGALYARCGHLDDPLLGGWFYGPHPGGALASLLYFMGTYAPVSHVRASALRPPGDPAPDETALDRAYAWARLEEITEPLDKARVLSLIGAHGGMLSGPDAGPSVITFPFRDANRASRTSRAAAHGLGIGTNR